MSWKVSLTLLALVPLLAPLVEFSAPIDLATLIWTLCLVLVLVLLSRGTRAQNAAMRHAKLILFLLGPLCAAVLSASLLSPHEPLTGDEPAYLVIASSLAHDADLDLSNNYRQKDYQRFGVESYRVFGHRAANGRIVPHHGPALGLLLSPFAAGVSRLGDRVTVAALRIAMGVILGLYLILVYTLALARGSLPSSSFAAAACAGLSSPLLFYSTQLYPDVLGGLMLAWLALEWVRGSSGARGRDASSSVALALLPVLGAKFVVPAVILGLALAWSRWRARRIGSTAGLLIGLAAGAAAYLATRAPLPLSEHLTADAGARLKLVPWWWLGYLIDQRAGLIFLAPVYLMVAAGLRSIRWSRDGVLLLAVAGYLGLYAYHLDWGGLCPPGRPLVAALWLAMALMADGFARAPRLAVLLAAISALVSAAYAFDHHALFLHLHPNAQSARSPLLEAWSVPGLDLSALAPFFSVDHTTTLPNLAAAAALALGVAALVHWSKRPTNVRPTHLGPDERPLHPDDAPGASTGANGWKGAGWSLFAVGAALLLLSWAWRLDPTGRLSPVNPDRVAGGLYTDAGPEWTDGWLPARRTISCWLRVVAPARLTLLSLTDSRVVLRGRDLRSELELEAGVPSEVPIPARWTGSTERLEVYVSKGVLPAQLAGSGEARALGVRVGLVPSTP